MLPNDLREPMIPPFESKMPRRTFSKDSRLADQMLAPSGDATSNFQQQQHMEDVLHATVLANDKAKKGTRVVTGLLGDGIVRRKDGVPARMLLRGVHRARARRHV